MVQYLAHSSLNFIFNYYQGKNTRGASTTEIVVEYKRGYWELETASGVIHVHFRDVYLENKNEYDLIYFERVGYSRKDLNMSFYEEVTSEYNIKNT